MSEARVFRHHFDEGTAVQVLQNSLSEIGTHRELLERDGLYARYWKRQSGGFMGFSEAAE